jgi:hypothetical protein
MAKPFATLKRAWTEAQKYTIVGNAILTVQFQKGIYNYTYTTSDTTTNPFPTNLYHPQGDNIIIQGDPTGIKQRYIYKVKDYSWDLSRWGFYGHTGTVNTWYAVHSGGQTAPNYPNPTCTGFTAHGFTGEDEGQYATISNAYMGGGGGGWICYRDRMNGVNSGRYNSVNDYTWGRYVFNHGLSYEEAYAIVGLARIEGASGSTEDLKLQFKYQNLDARIHTYPQTSLNTTGNGRIGGGLGNGISFCTIANNYPEPQYSNPNGYYGPTFGIVGGTSGTLITPNTGALLTAVSHMGYDSGVNITYPARGAESHVTDDAHLLTSYPVVIRSRSSGNFTDSIGTDALPIPLVLSGCNIKSIRNLMFVNANTEGATWDAKPPMTGLDSIVTMKLGSLVLGAAYPSAPELMLLEDGSRTAIRHIGCLGYGKGSTILGSITVNNSTLTADPVWDATNALTYQASIHGVGGQDVFPELGSIANTPVFFASHGGGIFVEGENSFVDLQVGSVVGRVANRLHTDATTWMQVTDTSSGILAYSGARLNLATTHIINASNLPGFERLRLDLPVFAGATLTSGITGAFFIPEILSNSRGGYYKSIIGYKNTGGTRVPVLKVLAVGSAGASYGPNTGWTAATWQGGTSSLSSYTARPVWTQPVYLYALRLNQVGMDTDASIRAWTSVAGNTLEFFAYQTDGTEGTTVPNEYLALGKDGIRFGTTGGYTLSGAIASANNYGITLGCLKLYGYQNLGNGMVLTDGSHATLAGTVLLSGRKYVGIYLRLGSVLAGRAAAWIGRDHTHSQILSESSSTFNLGSVYVKHPVGYGIGDGGNETQTNGYNFGLLARHGSKITVGCDTDNGNSVVVGTPYSTWATMNEAGHYMGIFSGGTSANIGTDDGTANHPIQITQASTLNIVNSTSLYSSLLGLYDGGKDKESNVSIAGVGLIEAGSSLNGIAGADHAFYPAQGQGSNTPSIMTRGAWGNGAVQQLLYNAPRGATMWWQKDTRGNIGNAASTSTVNGLWRRKFTPSGAYPNYANQTPQLAAAFDAANPGYSGNGYRIEANIAPGGVSDWMIYGA